MSSSNGDDEEQPPAPIGAWWSNVFTCAACLTQVEWPDIGTATAGDANALGQGLPPDAIEQQHDGRAAMILNNSLIDDEDSNQTSEHTITIDEDNISVRDITLDITTESYDEKQRRSPPAMNEHFIVTPTQDCVDYSSTIGEFGSFSYASETTIDNDEETNECPICLNVMSEADVMYPLSCPGMNCNYNFCLQCMTSLVKASKDSYELASDGSLHVKIHLNCPNCRASVKGIIEDVMSKREAALDECCFVIKTSRSIEEKMETVEFLENGIRIPRIKNRARAPSFIRKKRKSDLMTELISMPVPSNVRDQVLAVQSHADVLFPNTSSDGNVPSTPTFSSTISRPFYSGTMLISPDTEFNGGLRRHTRSFDTEMRSPSSVRDEAFWTGAIDHRSSSSAQKVQIHQAQGKKQCDVLTTGVKDDFLASLDLDWCCSSSNEVNTSDIIDISGHASSEYEQGCGGYVDYIGTYHECTAINASNRYAVGPCQGCIFRRGTYDDTGDVHNEELYYDSDCGQQFAVGTWKSTAVQHIEDQSISDASIGTHTTVPTNNKFVRSQSLSDSIFTLTPQRPGRLRSNSDVTPSLDDNNRDVVMEQYRTNSTPSSPIKSIRGRESNDDATHAEQQAYIYNYFSQGGSPVRTGVCSTMKADIRYCVQDTLNSRWRVVWHHVASEDNSSLLKRQPKACEVWIERGYCRNRNEFVEPKLMWRELTQPGLKQGTLTESTMNPYRVSLFALRRIVPIIDGDDWMRMSFDGQRPSHLNDWKLMAKPNCLIAVRSSVGNDFLFEASCPEERDRIVHLWKMTTARLVSHAVVGNTEMMMKEYFNEAAIQGGLYSSMMDGYK